MRRLLLLLLVWWATPAAAVPLDTWQDWVLNNPLTARRVNPVQFVARGSGTTDLYVMEVNPTTGGLIVEATFGATAIGVSNFPTTVDTDYGTPGASTPRSASMLGVGSTAVSNANPVPVSDAGGSLTVDDGASSLSVDDNGSTLSVDDGGGSLTVDGTVTVTDGSGSLTVDGTVSASNFPATVSTDSGAAGASTLRTVLATRHESAATPVSVRISDGSAFSTPAGKGRGYADSIRNVYSSTNVTTGAWVQLIASTAADINALLVFDSCGQTLELGTGAAASETRKLIIPPGGPDGPVPLYIPSGTRVAIRAISATCSVGEIDITGLN